jgi:hypothetical protein
MVKIRFVIIAIILPRSIHCVIVKSPTCIAGLSLGKVHGLKSEFQNMVEAGSESCHDISPYEEYVKADEGEASRDRSRAIDKAYELYRSDGNLIA